DPTDYKVGVRGLHFHKEDVKTTHRSCPGRNMVKANLVDEVSTYIDILDGGDHHTLPEEAHTDPAPVLLGDNAIIDTANKSAILGYHWHDRGVAPAAYIRGMALTFAQTYRLLRTSHPAAIEMSKPRPTDDDDEHDALSWYHSNFAALGMVNDGGADTLRHLF